MIEFDFATSSRPHIEPVEEYDEERDGDKVDDEDGRQ